MKSIPIYQIDAFASELFKGNPAAICPLTEWLSEQSMQQIAMENNLSETAFFVWEEEDLIRIKFYTPEVEIDLCGHATLATAYLIFQILKPELQTIKIQANKDLLVVRKEEGLVVMNFPSNPPAELSKPEGIECALGCESISETWVSGKMMMLVLKDEAAVLACNPDFVALKKYPYLFIPTTKGNISDFVSRVFGPSVGINEDPVTGSAHTLLIPFWSKRLSKNEMFARQVSKRGGDLYVKYLGERVEIAGSARLYLKGEIFI